MYYYPVFRVFLPGSDKLCGLQSSVIVCLKVRELRVGGLKFCNQFSIYFFPSLSMCGGPDNLCGFQYGEILHLKVGVRGWKFQFVQHIFSLGHDTV